MSKEQTIDVDDYPLIQRQLDALKSAYQKHGDLLREQMIDAVESAYKPGDRLPGGLVVAPECASDKMVEVGVGMALLVPISSNYSWEQYMRDLYRAMIFELVCEK